MRILRSLRRRLRSILNPEMANVELSEELQFHLARQLEENLAAGMPPDEARRAAQIELGTVARITEQCHNTRGLILLQELLRNGRYGVRSFRKNPAFTVVTLLTLSLGIGICTAMFTVFTVYCYDPCHMSMPINWPLPTSRFNLAIQPSPESPAPMLATGANRAG